LGLKYSGRGQCLFAAENEETEKHSKKEGFKPVVISVDEMPKNFYKIILTANPDRLPEVEEFLKPMAQGFRTVYSEKQFLEILDNETSKGRLWPSLQK